MARPRPSDSYSSYTDQLVYFGARLAADPLTAELAPQVAEILTAIDDAQLAVREARRAEVRARALRDHRDKVGDDRVRKYKRRVDVVEADFVDERLFPQGVYFVVAPRGGRTQLERLEQLDTGTKELLGSPRLGAHAESEELTEILQGGEALLAELIPELRSVVEQWEEQTLEVARARDLFEFRRAEGVAKLGAVIGELRVRLDGSSRAAYAYTQPARSREGDEDAPDELDEDALDKVD